MQDEFSNAEDPQGAKHDDAKPDALHHSDGALPPLPPTLLSDYEALTRRFLARANGEPDAGQHEIFCQVNILRLALKNLSEGAYDTHKFCRALCNQLRAAGPLPRRRGGKDGSWDHETIGVWLKAGRASPPEAYHQAIRNAALAVAGRVFGQRRQGQPLDEAIRGWNEPATCFRCVFGSLVPPPRTMQYRTPLGHMPVRGRSFKSKPDPIDAEPLLAHAERALEVLSAVPGHRLVIVKGQPHSGKKTVLRLFLELLKRDYLPLADGTKLPVLAVALDDYTSSELIDEVYNFYNAPALAQKGGSGSARAEAPPLPSNIDHPAQLDPQEKLDRIAQLAQEYPACVLFADVAPIDSDPIVRALAQDYVGEILFRIMRGNKLTRLLVTAPDGLATRVEFDAASIERAATVINVAETISVNPHALQNRGIIGWLPFTDGARIRPITFTLAVVAKKLIEQRCANARAIPTHRRNLRVAVDTDSPERISEQIWYHLLNPGERVSLGLIALSHDGLRLSTLKRLLLAFRRLASQAWADGPNADDVVELNPLLIEHLIREYIPVRKNADLGEPTYVVDDGWRRLMIQAWYAHSPEHARLGQWLIAREAATQSRDIRTTDSEDNASLGFSRDIQALCALVSSLDLTAIRPMKMSSPGGAYLESIVLPPLEDQSALPPNPTLAIRYAYLQLYRNDFEGDAFQYQADDATLRLSVLLPFFEPRAPWLRIDDIRLEQDINRYDHLKEAFTPSELLRLLASVAMAAIRLRRLDLVCAVARLAEQCTELPDARVTYRELLLPLRAEVDAGLISGGNPEDFHLGRVRTTLNGKPDKPQPGTQVSAVCQRIRTLLQTPFGVPPGEPPPRELQVVRGKLYARLGEALHIAGDRVASRKAFHQALATEEDFSRHALHLGAVLGGRGARAYLRLLLDQARRFAINKHFKFQDGLLLPIPRRVVLDNAELLEARNLFSMNARRLGRGRGADKIGARIDAARLSALVYDFDAALAHLDLAATSRFANGTSIEVLLELLAVRTRITVDAAVVALVALDENGSSIVEPALMNKLAEFLRQQLRNTNTPAHVSQKGLNATEWAAKILERRARHTSEVFHRYASAWGNHHPYYTFSRYMKAWSDIVSARLSAVPEARARTKLQDALGHIEDLRNHMFEGDYRMHLMEAGTLARCLRAFISSPAAT